MDTLLEAGASPDAKCRSGHVLKLAIIYADGDYRHVDSLVDAGVNANLLDERGRPVLYWALIVKDPQLVRILLNAGADPNATDTEGRTLVYYATVYDLPEIVSILVAGR